MLIMHTGGITPMFTPHGLYGLRTILFELTLKPSLEKAVSAVLALAGLGLFGLGTIQPPIPSPT
jgi:succinate dehydrogenase hydrophobic anchor subunit